MYFIIEIQTFANGTAAHLVTAEANLNQAESIYHQKLAAAAISDLPHHAVSMLDNKGFLIKSFYYDHEVPSEEATGNE